MAPKPQEISPVTNDVGDAETAGNRVVISGMAGLYPDCYNVDELEKVLYDKVNPVLSKKPRWTYNHPELINHIGLVPGLNRFDAQFFKVHYKLANNMDSMGRKVLEQVYQAIYDAGISPEHFNGKKVGVYIGSCTSESEKACFYGAEMKSGFGIAGCSKAMFANRVSYWLNAKGPSMSIDQASCSSTVALELGYQGIIRGDCEAAIVGGCNLCLHPQTLIHCGRCMKLCSDGKTKSFDINADGCASSESINVLLLQKAKDACRIYAEVVHVKNDFTTLLNIETGPKFGFYRSIDNMTNFIKDFYKEARVDPKEVSYVEALGCAIKEVDKTELEALSNVYCNEKRKEPLLVGSVISNIGYTDAASGIASVTKVLMGYRKGLLAGNLYCDNPRNDLPALRDGSMQIVTDHHEFNRGYAAVNGLSIAGINSHVLLNGVYKHKDLSRFESKIPRLVTISARQQSGVDIILNDLKCHPIDAEQLALFYNIHQTTITGHLGRGFTILDTNEEKETVALVEKSDYFDVVMKPLWFVYSGMGSQWTGMGAQLMRIPIFAAAIERCHKVLQPKGVNIVDIITSSEKTTFDNILHSFVGIAAIQIGLTDILTAIGLVPDKIIGHSVGELGCAYADGCFTAEEMILSAYSRGLVSIQTPFIRGSMAAVGLGYQQILNLCPPEIEVACHNSADSSTISGPADKMKEFVKELTDKGIFAKEVPSSNIAYHSRYIADAGPGLLKILKEVIKDPKARSDKWVSTSVPKEKWDEPIAKLSSAEYHTNNLLSPVLFEETSSLIPNNAVCVEIAPHGLLQAILKRSLPTSCKNIALTRRGHNDNALHMLEAIGNLYMEGYNLRLEALYPKVEFPVSTATPMMGHLIEWAHHELWSIPLYASAHKKTCALYKEVISLHDEDHSYLRGHVIRGKTVFPYAAMLIYVWDTINMILGVQRRTKIVQFHDVHLLAQPVLHDQKQLRINVALNRGNGRFEVTHEDTEVATGYVTVFANKYENDRAFQFKKPESKSRILNSKDIYELLFTRDYAYENEFRSIVSADTTFSEVEISWRKNWVTFLDAMIQLQMLRRQRTNCHVNFIKRILINVDEQPDIETNYIANVWEHLELTRCGGVIMESLRFQNAMSSEASNLSLKSLKDPSQGFKKENFNTISEPASNKRKATLFCEQIGNLESLQWVEQPEQNKPGIDVEVLFAGLNTIDAGRAAGTVPLKNKIAFGMDFSGYNIKNGARVMGLVAQGSMSTKIRANKHLLWPVPDHWSMEDAATVPLAYCLALYALVIKCNLQRGDSILVHSGTGALGQACISIALAFGCDVFTTVSDKKKKTFLKKLFPMIDDNHIGNSRDHTFRDQVLSMTNGLGCTIAIGGLKGELKNCSIATCGTGGIYLDTIQLTTQEEFLYGMSALTFDRSFININLDTVFKAEYKEIAVRLQSLLSDGIVRGYVVPLTRVTYTPSDVTRAFKLLSAAQHRGKVLIDFQNPIAVAKFRLQVSEENCHVIFTDSNALGIQLAERLVDRGAKKLLFVTSQKGNTVHYSIEMARKFGLRAEFQLENWNEIDILKTLNSAARLGVVESIYTAVSRHDVEFGPFLENILNLAKKSCPSLRNFIVIEVDNKLRTSPLPTHNGVLSKLIVLPPVKLFGVDSKENDTMDIATAIDGIEQALLIKESTIIVQNIAKQTSLLGKIQKILRVEVEQDGVLDVPIGEMIKDSSKMYVLKELLKFECNVSFTDTQMEKLTLNKILDIERMNYIQHNKDTNALETFITKSEPDELDSTTEMTFLPTLTSSSLMRDDEFDMNQTHLCIVPGIEGNHDRFRLMCERLKLPAVVLQPGLDRPNETIDEMADRFTNMLLKKTKVNNFYLLGYEAGIFVALQIAAKLEQHGLTGTVFCLGGSPNEILQEFKSKFGHFDEKTLQNNVLKYMLSLFTEEHIDNLEIDLRDGLEWSEKIAFNVQNYLSRFDYSAQYVKEFIKTVYGQIANILKYTMKPLKLKSRIILLRAQQLSTKDLSIKDYSYEPVDIFELEESLAYSAKDLRCAAIINSHLDKKILEDFANKNRCETYLLNSNALIFTIDC